MDSIDLGAIVPQGLDPRIARRVAKHIVGMPELEELPPDQASEVIATMVAKEHERELRLRRFVTELESNRDALVKARREIEQRWADDLRLYEGDTQTMVSKDHATEGDAATGAPPKINLTRSRTNTIAARIGDTLFPSDDRNWDMDPEDEAADPKPPSPSMQGGAQAAFPPPGQSPQDAQGQPPEVAVDTSRADQQSDNQRKVERMRARCDSQMRAAGYTEHGRKMIDQGCILGTGVMKGPFNVKRRKKRYETRPDGVSVLQMQEVVEPSSTWVDVRYVYFDTAVDPARRERVCEFHPYTDHEMRKLAAEQGFEKEVIQSLLSHPSEGRSLGEVGINITNWNSRAPITDDCAGKWPVWEHHVILSREEMEALGLEPDKSLDVLPPVEVWTCNGELLKAAFYAIEGAERLMYQSWNYQAAPNSPYGYGVPYLYRSSQRSIDAEWHIGLHNLSVSSGPQVIYRDGHVKPADGRMMVRGPKVWRVSSDSELDIDKVFDAKIIPNNADQILKWLEVTIQLGDDEINLPAIAQGNPSQAEPTASGLIQRMTASTIVQRRIAKSADDNVIRPHAEGYYDWNMQFSTDPDIKVNAIVRARGASDLMHKDIQAQHLQVLSQITDNPRYAGFTDDYEFLALMFKTTAVPADLLLWEREKAEQNRAQMQQAQVQVSQVEQAKAAAVEAEMQYKQARLQLDAEKMRADDDFRRRDRELDHVEHQNEMRDRNDERLLKLVMKESDTELEANKQVSSELLEQAKLQLQQTSAALNAGFQAEKLDMEERKTALEVAVEAPDPRLA